MTVQAVMEINDAPTAMISSDFLTWPERELLRARRDVLILVGMADLDQEDNAIRMVGWATIAQVISGTDVDVTGSVCSDSFRFSRHLRYGPTGAMSW